MENEKELIAKYIFESMKETYKNPSDENKKETLKRVKLVLDKHNKFDHEILKNLILNYNIRPIWQTTNNGINSMTYVGLRYKDQVFQL